MNPKENDHRTLGYLLRIAYGIVGLKVDKEIEKKEKLDFVHKLNRTKKPDHDLIISYIIRISNVLLKREWERVKYGK